MAGRRGPIPALITSARAPRSLDTGERTRRYFLSMAVRVVCFISACFAPLPWNLLLFVGAAVIPGVAVILANAVDRRTPPAPAPQEAAPDLPALPGGLVIPGDLDEPEPPAGAPGAAA